jgi:hypothetical protein
MAGSMIQTTMEGSVNSLTSTFNSYSSIVSVKNNSNGFWKYLSLRIGSSGQINQSDFKVDSKLVNVGTAKWYDLEQQLTFEPFTDLYPNVYYAWNRTHLHI